MRIISIVGGVLLLLVVVLVGWLHRRYTALPLRMEGWTAPAWRAVAFAFRSNLELDMERGAGFAVYHRGQLVVDLLGGYMDAEHGREWSREHVTPLLSVTKALSALSLLKLADDGHVNVSGLVTEHWPEFAFAGKAAITVEQLLSHQAGVLAADGAIRRTDLVEDRHQEVGQQLARAVPAWPPGTAAGFHSATYGLLLDQLVRRADPKHRSLARHFHQELAAPAGALLYVGLPRADFWRLARVYPAALHGLPASLAALDMAGVHRAVSALRGHPGHALRRNASAALTPALRLAQGGLSPEMAELAEPSQLGFGSAAALARLFAPLAGDGRFETRRVLSEAAVRSWWTPAFRGQDLVLDEPLVWNHGCARLERNSFRRQTEAETEDVAVIRGAGGQLVLLDRHAALAVAYVTNHLHGGSADVDPVHRRLLHAVYRAVDKKTPAAAPTPS